MWTIVSNIDLIHFGVCRHSNWKFEMRWTGQLANNGAIKLIEQNQALDFAFDYNHESIGISADGTGMLKVITSKATHEATSVGVNMHLPTNNQIYSVMYKVQQSLVPATNSRMQIMAKKTNYLSVYVRSDACRSHPVNHINATTLFFVQHMTHTRNEISPETTSNATLKSC